MINNTLTKGRTLYHRSGIKGVITKRINYGNTEYGTSYEVLFEEALADGNDCRIYRAAEIGSELFLSIEEIKKWQLEVELEKIGRAHV